jgi:UDPglucose 6-dehydrogenase
VHVYDPAHPHHASDDSFSKAYSADIVISCVPTPQDDDGRIDLTLMDETVAHWDAAGRRGIFVIKSTVPCGTVDNYNAQYATDKVIHNPEFLTERTHMHDFLHPIDVIVGGAPEHCALLASLYEEFYGQPVRVCSAREAELVKTVRNSFYATKVVFMNEVFRLCEALGVDYDSYREVLTDGGRHSWWGPEHTMVPGPDGLFGYGGKCFPKDVSGLLALAAVAGVDMRVLSGASESNAVFRGHV